MYKENICFESEIKLKAIYINSSRDFGLFYSKIIVIHLAWQSVGESIQMHTSAWNNAWRDTWGIPLPVETGKVAHMTLKPNKRTTTTKLVSFLKTMLWWIWAVIYQYSHWVFNICTRHCVWWEYTDFVIHGIYIDLPMYSEILRLQIYCYYHRIVINYTLTVRGEKN